MNTHQALHKISVIIPVFRNEESLILLIEELEKVLIGTYVKEYLFVDDGSDDNSLNVLLSLQKKYPEIIVLELSRNFGQVPAISAGLHEANGDIVVIISADLQDPVALIPKMINEWRRGYDIVIAHRANREDSFFQKKTAQIFYFFLKFSNINMPSGGFDYVLLDKKVVNILDQMPVKNRFLQGDILSLGFEVHLVSYTRKKRSKGKSQWTHRARLLYFFNAVLVTARWPVILFFGISIILFWLSVGFLFVYLFDLPSNLGLTTKGLVVFLITIGGLMFSIFGLFGAYLLRMYDVFSGRPGYILKKKHLGN